MIWNHLKKVQRITLKSCFIVLIVFFLFGITKISQFYFSDNSQLILVADRENPRVDAKIKYGDMNYDERKIELIKIEYKENGYFRKKSKKLIPYPYSNRFDRYHFTFGKFRNLINNVENSNSYFFNMANTEDEWAVFKIGYNFWTDKIYATDLVKIKNNQFLRDYNIVGVDSTGKNFLIQDGGELHLSEAKISRNGILGSKIKFFSCGAKYQGDHSIITQGMNLDSSKESKSFYPNILSRSSNKVNESKFIESGYLHIMFLGSDPYPNTPLALSADKNRVIFLAYYHGKSPSYELWICSWNINNNTIERILKIQDNTWRVYKSESIICNPDIDRNLFAANLTNGILIVDMDKKKITKTITDLEECRSIRWSRDGKKLGILDTKGKLYLYCLDNDKYSMIDQDQDYFDFIWIK